MTGLTFRKNAAICLNTKERVATANVKGMDSVEIDSEKPPIVFTVS